MLRTSLKKLLNATIAASTLLCGTTLSASAQDQIRIVGSSTVFPFATAAAEEFGNTAPFKTPIVEATGTGGGLKLFCAGIGVGHPDIVNASRRIKKTEIDVCRSNGVNDIVEIKIGFDGIVLASSKESQSMQLSLRDLYLALAAEIPAPGTEGGMGNMIANPHNSWRDINPALPNQPIMVLGPPPTSGTRDAFNELAIEAGCNTFSGMMALKQSNMRVHQSLCHAIREDGAFVEVGENDNLIVQKIQTNKQAIGIFGFSFLDQNTDVIKAHIITNTENEAYELTPETISGGEYPISRSLFLYAKKAHLGAVPGLREYLNEITSERASGEYGYLTDRGLIPLPDDERKRSQSVARNMVSLTENFKTDF